VLARLASASLAALALGACTHVGGAGPGGANAWTKHGILRIVNISEPDTLNPDVGNSQVDTDLAEFWGGQLFNWTDKNTFDPELAAQEPTLANGGISKDGKTYTYHLRKGVLWHDGAPFTADDVIFSWHVIMNKNNNVPSTVGFELITAIDKPDDHTIVVHLKAPYAPFVSTFFAPSSTPYVVLPKHLLEKYPNINNVAYNSAPVGTGPFTVERWQRGSKIVFKANPHYWRGPPKLQEIWYTPVPDENTILTLLGAHEADFEYQLTSNHYEQVQKLPGFRTVLTPFTQYGQLALNLKTPALSDVRVRRAIAYALDRKALIQDVSHGVNVPGYSDQPDFLWAYNPNVTHYDYDPKKADALLDEAGWTVGSDGFRIKDGKRLSLTLAGITGLANGNAVNVLAQRYLHDVGIDVVIKLYPSSLFLASYGAGGITQTGKFDLGFFSWLNGVDPDDSTLWMCNQFPPAGQNVYRFCDKTLDEQEHIALTNADPAARKAAYFRVQEILADRIPMYVTWYVRRVQVLSTDFKGFKPAHAVTTFWNSYEWEI
jgi:peptide/nickel transport system substrate-binding protein